MAPVSWRDENPILLWRAAIVTEAELLVLKADADRFAPVATYGVGDHATWAHLAVAPNAVLVKDVRTLTLWRVP